MAVKKGGNTAGRVSELAKPIAEELGLSLWDTVYEKEGSLRYLRVYIDKEDGVDMNDCENMTRRLSDVLDKADPIEESYILEVGSPGLGRILRLPRHFREFLECPVRIRYIRETDGMKEFIAVMTAYDEDNGTITDVAQDDREYVVKLSDTAFVKLCDDEDLFGGADDE